MTSNELLDQIHKFKDIFSKYEELLYMFAELSLASQDFIKITQDTLPSLGDLTGVEAEKYIKTTSEQAKSVKKFSPRQMFLMIEGFKDSLIRYTAENSVFIEEAIAFEKQLEVFARFYELYLNTLDNSFALIIQGDKVWTQFNQLKTLFSSITESLTPEPSLKQDEAQMYIYLEDDVGNQEILVKIQSLFRLYEEICFLLNVSTASNPLRILKVETGSFFAAIAGYIQSIGFMKWFLTEFTKFTYRNLTNEGKLKQIENKLETYEKALSFRERLKQAGVKDDESLEKINKGFITLIDEANNLIKGQSSIKVDSSEISLTSEWDKSILKEGKMRYIGDGEKTDPQLSDGKENNL